jgi:hypothetical protein
MLVITGDFYGDFILAYIYNNYKHLKHHKNFDNLFQALNYIKSYNKKYKINIIHKQCIYGVRLHADSMYLEFNTYEIEITKLLYYLMFNYNLDIIFEGGY